MNQLVPEHGSNTIMTILFVHILIVNRPLAFIFEKPGRAGVDFTECSAPLRCFRLGEQLRLKNTGIFL